MYYTGVGSRETPESVLSEMTRIAIALRIKGLKMRSGKAPGADTAFEIGAGTEKQIFVPWDGFQGGRLEYQVWDECYEIASKFHPAWEYLGRGARALMARNVLQVLGPNLNEPSEFTICWTPDGAYTQAMRGKKTGGTGLAISISCANGVPVFNLKNKIHHNFVMNTLIK